MKPSFHTRLVNDPFEDPCLYIRFLWEARALLFDAGFTTNLSTRDILKISDIFISHTHIDHFIGFDSILRLHLGRDKALRLYGPQGFIDCVEGRMRGYTWNLIGDYPIVIEAHEVTDECIKICAFRSNALFKREDLGVKPFEGIILDEPLFKVKAAILDHQVPCLAFSLEEGFHINIDKARLSSMGLSVGQWLRRLKMAIREGKGDEVFTLNGKGYALSELMGIVNITKGQKVSYVADAIGSDDNIKRIVELVEGSDVLYIETYFLDKDTERARQRYHLTARQAGMIGGMARVKRIVPFHFSPRYTDNPDDLIEEALKEFDKYKARSTSIVSSK
ncbi:MAG: ribonuclease Z [Thermodesulfovibrionia bacterium]